MQRKSNLVTTTDDYSNLYVQNLTFYFYDLEPDPMTLVLKLSSDLLTYQNEVNRSVGLKGIRKRENSSFLVAITLTLTP